jgi:1-phosphofructokinase family hexose kinase
VFSGGGYFSSIITVGVCPCWDITCYVEGADWGAHVRISAQNCEPAGKALNISKALAWLGTKSTAAGLWGRSDYQQLLEGTEPLSEYIRAEFTLVDGRTRRNVTVVDTVGKREMHLRARSELATRETLSLLQKDIERAVRETSVCVFAGAMPGGELLDDCLDMLGACRSAGARIVVDGSGNALKRAVDSGGLWLIKPNLSELCELLDQSITDEPKAITQAACKLLEKVEIVLVSRGEAGAVVVGRETSLQGIVKSSVPALSTVGCGDYLLAGFLDGLVSSDDISFALQRGLKAAAARAFGWAGRISWDDAESRMEAIVSALG